MRGVCNNRKNWIGQIVQFGFLIALAVQTLIPNGYMLSKADDGLVVEMCGGGTTSYMHIDLATGKVEVSETAPNTDFDHSDTTTDSTCLFALANHTPTPTQVFELLPPARAPPHAQTLSQNTHNLHRLVGAPLPARGPPLAA